MDVICALLVLFASSSCVRLASAGMAPLMGSFVPVGRPQSEEEVRMLVQSAAKAFPMAPPAPAPAARENMYRGREGKTLARPMATRMPKKLVSTITRMPKMMKYRYGVHTAVHGVEQCFLLA